MAATVGESLDARLEPQHLARAMGPLDATMIVVGSMIGSGIFLVSAESSRMVGAPGWLLVAWGVAGVMTMTGALSCAELAAMMPRAGGQYVFLREAYSPAVGFLFGWAFLFIIQTGTIAAVGVAFANFLGVLVPQVSPSDYLIAPLVFGRYAVSLSLQQSVAIAMILLLTVVNTRGLRLGTIIQNTLTSIKTVALLGVVIVGLTLGANRGGAAFTAAWWNPVANGWDPQRAQAGLGLTGGLALAALFGRAMIGPLFAQSAWNNVTFTAGEMRDPGRTLPRALIAGCGLVVALYMLTNVAYLVTLPFAGIQAAPQDRVATAVMQAVFGRIGTLVMASAIVISTFGANNGLILAGARVMYAMACDGVLFRRMGTVNAHRVPAVALVAQGVWASALTLVRTVTRDPHTGATTYGNVYTQLLEYIVSADLVFYILMVAAVIILRRKAAEVARPHRTIGYPVVPIVYIVLASVLVIDLAYVTPLTAGVGYLLVLTGVPVYLIRSRVSPTS